MIQLLQLSFKIAAKDLFSTMALLEILLFKSCYASIAPDGGDFTVKHVVSIRMHFVYCHVSVLVCSKKLFVPKMNDIYNLRDPIGISALILLSL